MNFSLSEVWSLYALQSVFTTFDATEGFAGDDFGGMISTPMECNVEGLLRGSLCHTRPNNALLTPTMYSLGLRFVPSRSTSVFSRLRSYHQLEKLPYPIENGLGDFLPPEALKVVAIDYQAGLLQHLNEELRGMLVPSYNHLRLMAAYSKRRAGSIRHADSDRRVSASGKDIGF
jgi:hypothetical protein